MEAVNVTVLRRPDGGTVYLLGTCHMASGSAAAAADLVRRVKPSAVVVELCDGRRHMLNHSHGGATQLSDAGSSGVSLADVAGTLSDALKDWTSLISLQYDALGSLETAPVGGEFRAAVDEALTLNARVVLGDRSMELTQQRPRRLVPISEIVWALLFEDGTWAEAQAHRRYCEAHELQATSDALARALALPSSDEREAKLRALCTTLAHQTERAVTAAVPGFADAVLYDLLRRFWCKELIGEAQVTAMSYTGWACVTLIGRDMSDSLISLSRALSRLQRQRLRESLEAYTHLDHLDLYYTPTCRRILLDERDWVLAEALHTALGPTGSQSSEIGAVVGVVVGVVGKSHVPGITAAWNAPEATRREKVAKALEEPPPPSRLLALGGGALGLGALVGIARSRTMRRVAGASSLALGGGATWLVVALRDRLDYFERSQK